MRKGPIVTAIIGLGSGLSLTPAAAAPDGVIVLPLKLQIDTKTALKPAWGTASTALTQNSVDDAGGSKTVTLRYFAGGAKVPGTRPITIEASDDPKFKTIPITKLLRPRRDGVIEAGAALNLPAPYGPVVYGSDATWYLRAKGMAFHGQPPAHSNTVTVKVTLKSK